MLPTANSSQAAYLNTSVVFVVFSMCDAKRPVNYVPLVVVTKSCTVIVDITHNVD